MTRLSFPPADPFTPLVERLRAHAARHPERVALRHLLTGEVDGPIRTWDYGTLDAQARTIAAHLQALADPVGPVLILHPTGLEFAAALLGCLYAGVTAIPAMPLDPARARRLLPRLLSILADSGARLVLTDPATAESTRALLQPAKQFAAIEFLSTEMLDSAAAARWRPPVLAPDTLALLQYTSGSTGDPKGVMITHGNLVANARLLDQFYPADVPLSWVSWLPLFHDMGLIGNLLHGSWAGGEVTLFAPEAFLLRPLRWVRAVSAFGANVTGAPDFAYALCASKAAGADLTGLDLSRLVFAYCGAEPVRGSSFEAFARAFAPYGFRREAFSPGYGLAEATLLVTSMAVAAPPVERRFNVPLLEQEGRAVEVGPSEPARSLMSCGPPKHGLDLRIVHPVSLHALPEGRVGEIWLRGPSITPGYWKRPDAPLFRSILGEDDGAYLRTGDLGFVQEGQLYPCARLKDLIILRGRNLYPQDLERTVEEAHPAIRMGCSAAFSLPSEDLGEGVAVVAELDPRAAADSEAVVAAIRKALAEEHEVSPRVIALVAPRTIAKTTSGKIARTQCRDALLTGHLEVLHREVAPALAAAPGSLEASGDVQAVIAALWKELTGVAPRGPEHNIFSTGADSLTAVRFAVRFEELLGREIPYTLLWEVQTFGQMVELARGPFQRPVIASTLQTDTVLDPAIRATGEKVTEQKVRHPERILLTGATGFLGAHLLGELHRRTGATVLCLVRAADATAGLLRLRANLQRYPVEGVDLSRVRIVVGDVALPRLGLSETAFAELAHEVDSIYHNAAVLNWVQPYEALRTANVLGTHEILRLAALGPVKPVHYLSSIAASQHFQHQLRFGPDVPAALSAGLDADYLRRRFLQVGYIQSKWVADELVVNARSAGIPASTYRISYIMGHSRSGLVAWDSLHCRLLRGCARLGWAPMQDGVIDMVAVDFIAAAVAQLALDPERLSGTYTLASAAPLPWSRMVERLVRRGHRIQLEPPKPWLARVRAGLRGAAALDPDLIALLGFFEHSALDRLVGAYPAYRRSLAMISGRTTYKALGTSGPLVDEEQIDQTLLWMERNGHLPAAPPT